MLKRFFNRKKGIHAQSVVDLRDYTPQALNNIKVIEAVALLILPENPSNEFIEAFSKIELSAVGFKLNLPSDKRLAMFNGVTSLSSVKLADNTVGVFNGITIVGRILENENAQYIANGIVLKKIGLQNKSQCLIENGMIFEMDFDENKVKLFSNKVEIDASFIRNIQEGTLIAAGDTITFNNDVTEEIIVEKNLQFFAGNTIKCNKDIKGCVQARSCVGRKIVIE